MSKTGYPEPLAKVALPAGGTWKPLEASRGCSWPRIVADFANQPLPDASGVALGSLGVDVGELAAPKMMIFERLFWFFPRALFAARFGFLRYFFISFSGLLGRARRRAKCEN